MYQTELFDLDSWGRTRGMVIAPHPELRHLHVVLPCVGCHGFAPADRLTGVWCALVDVHTPLALRFRMPYACIESPDVLWTRATDRLTQALTHLQSEQRIHDLDEHPSFLDWLDPAWWTPDPHDLVWQACQSGLVSLHTQGQVQSETWGSRTESVAPNNVEQHMSCVTQELTTLVSLMPRDVRQILEERRNLSWSMVCRLMALAPNKRQDERAYILQALRTEPMPVLKHLASEPRHDTNTSLRAVVLGTRRAKDHWNAECVPSWLRKLAWRSVSALSASPLPYESWLALLRLLGRLMVTDRFVLQQIAHAWAQIERRHAIGLADYEQMIEMVWRLGRLTKTLHEDLRGLASNLSSPALQIDGPIGRPQRWAQVMHKLRQASPSHRHQVITLMCKPSANVPLLLSLLSDIGICEVTERINNLLHLQPDIPAQLVLPAHLSVRCLNHLDDIHTVGRQLRNCLASTETVLKGLTRAAALYLISRHGTPLAALAIQRNRETSCAFKLKYADFAESANATPGIDATKAGEAVLKAMETCESDWHRFEDATHDIAKWESLLSSVHHVAKAHHSCSISLIQRRLHLGYNISKTLIENLNAPPQTTAIQKKCTKDPAMSESKFPQHALEKFSGCDCDEQSAGTPSNPSIWLFGIEHGTFRSIHDETYNNEAPDDNYSVATQLRWPYNQKAFKLLAAIDGHPCSDYLKFAQTKQPFVKGVHGYFKGNLYPMACRSIGTWTDQSISETGFTSKSEYQSWCNSRRIPTIHAWINEYQPRLFIGVGIRHVNDFVEAVFGERAPLSHHQLLVNGSKKNIYYRTEDWRRLVVIPHFSGSNGLNSNESIQQVGNFIRQSILQNEAPRASASSTVTTNT